MKTAVVGMVKNEKDIIRPFVEHLLALFDQVLLVDHASTDGTREYLDAVATICPERFRLYHFTEPGQYQSEVTTWAMRQVTTAGDCDWVFALDADEFLPFADRVAFEQALSAHEETPVIAMPWRNAMPVTGGGEALLAQAFFVAGQVSRYVKVAFQPARLEPSTTQFSYGNHFLQDASKGRAVNGKTAFNIYHFPIRNRSQFMKKLLQGLTSDMKRGDDWKKGENVHRSEMVEFVRRHGLTEDLMRLMTLRYGERFSGEGEGLLQHLENTAYETKQLDLARVDLGVAGPASSAADDDAGLLVAVADMLISPATAPQMKGRWRLRLVDGKHLEVNAGTAQRHHSQSIASLGRRLRALFAKRRSHRTS